MKGVFVKHDAGLHGSHLCSFVKRIQQASLLMRNSTVRLDRPVQKQHILLYAVVGDTGVALVGLINYLVKNGKFRVNYGNLPKISVN